jgi:hypothetical protein
VRVRIVYGQPFGRGSDVEVLVGGNQGDRAEPGSVLESMDVEGDRQLHGIVRPEPVLASF